ncbi:MAG: Uma2 family endonuclease [Polyangiales bacterium]
MAATVPSPKSLTWRDFARLDDRESLRGHELVDGLIEEGEVPSRKHGRIVSRLVAILLAWLDQNGGGELLSQDNRVRIGSRRVRKPDVFLVRAADRPEFEDETLVSAPFLVVEVVTNTPRDETRDRVAKLADYESIGARSYWIVDPEADALDAYALGPDHLYGDARHFGPDEILDGAAFGLPGLRFSIRSLGA